MNYLPLTKVQNLYICITNFILTKHTLSELARMRFCVSASGLRGWCVTVMGVAFSPASCATSKADINTGPTPDFNMLLTSKVSLSQLPSVVTRLGIPVTPPTSAGVRGLLSWSFASWKLQYKCGFHRDGPKQFTCTAFQLNEMLCDRRNWKIYLLLFQFTTV